MYSGYFVEVGGGGTRAELVLSKLKMIVCFTNQIFFLREQVKLLYYYILSLTPSSIISMIQTQDADSNILIHLPVVCRFWGVGSRRVRVLSNSSWTDHPELDLRLVEDISVGPNPIK